MNYEVIDNYLSDADHLTILSTMTSVSFPWYYNPSIVAESGENPYDYQFGHIFYRDYQTWSNHFITIRPLIDAIKPKALIRVKGNMNPPTGEHYYGGWHNDYDFPCTTAVYYLNTTNGWTEFENGERVESVANRLLVFDSQLRHSGVTCTDQKTRVLLNLNYYA